MIVGTPAGDGTGSVVRRAHPDVQIVEVVGRPNLAELRGAAVAAARGSIIAFTDAHCAVEHGWVYAIASALECADVAAGAVRFGAPPTTANWAAFLYDYGPFLPPIAAGSTTTLSGNNIAFRREVLGDLRGFATRGFWKAFEIDRLAARGCRLVASPGMIVSWRRTATLVEVIRLRYHFGRCFAAMRLAGAGPLFGTVYRIAAPALPLLVVTRAVVRLVKKPGPLAQTVLALPAFVAIATAWGLGESVGALFGRGVSCREVY